MFSQRISVILVLGVVMLFSSGVFAADTTILNNNNVSMLDKSKTTVTTSNEVYVNPIKGNDNNIGSKDKPYRTIYKALNEVKVGGTIHLARETYIDSGLKITKNITIAGAGAGKTILDGEHSNRIFTISWGVNVKIENLTLTNGQADDGAAIYNKGICTLNNCILAGNNGTNHGGAINDRYGSAAILNDCTFINNTAPYGGAVFQDQGKLDVHNCTFKSNAADFGGAIKNSCNAIDNLSGCTFKNNKANYYGGAISNDDTFTKCTINGCTLIYNTASIGNAIYNNKGNTVDARYNWWGSNNDPSSQVSGDVDYSNWLVLKIITSKNNTVAGDKVTLIADLQHDNNGNYVTGVHVPDNTVIIFSSNNGTLNPQTITLTNGIAKTIFMPTNAGLSIIKATIDMQTVQTNITIKQAFTKLIVGNVIGIKCKIVNLTAKLIDRNKKAIIGKKITFKIDGKIIGTATTTNNGIATLKYRITKNKGTYTIYANFAGDDTFLNSIGTGHLTVKK